MTHITATTFGLCKICNELSIRYNMISFCLDFRHKEKLQFLFFYAISLKGVSDNVEKPKL